MKDAARERELLRAKKAADKEAEARREAADRREQARTEAAERRAEWTAWFQSLSDAMQLILILAAVAMPIGIGIVFWLVIGFAHHR